MKKLKQTVVSLNLKPLTLLELSFSFLCFICITIFFTYADSINPIDTTKPLPHQNNNIINVHNIDLISIGTSSSREAFILEEELSQQLQNSFDIKKKFLDLSSDNQSLSESLQYLEQLRLSEKHTIILNVSPTTFSRLGNNAIKNNSLKFKRRHIYIYFKKKLESYSRINIYGKPDDNNRYNYLYHKSGNALTINNHRIERTTKLAENYHDQAQLNLNQLLKIIRHIKKVGAKLFLFEQPHIDNETVFKPYLSDYHKKLASLIKNYQVKYINLNDSISLNKNDFIDVVHVSPSGREKWSNTFLKWISQNKLLLEPK